MCENYLEEIHGRPVYCPPAALLIIILLSTHGGLKLLNSAGHKHRVEIGVGIVYYNNIMTLNVEKLRTAVNIRFRHLYGNAT